MSFQYVPSLLRLPKIPNYTPPNGFWCGLGEDKGFYAFYMSNWSRYIMTDTEFCYSLEVDGSVLTPVFSSVNGYIFWRGNGYVYYSRDWGWVWCGVFPGYEPIEESEYDSEKEERVYSGDSFYTIGQLPYEEGKEKEMTGRGSAHDKDKKTIKVVWKRWESNTEFGKYEGKGGVSGEKYLGLPRFSGNGTYYIRSFAKEKGYYKYGAIHFADGKWVIGEIGSSGGWYEGSEPSIDKSVTFKFSVNKDSEAMGEDITISLRDYVKGDETAPVFLGEAAIWR